MRFAKLKDNLLVSISALAALFLPAAAVADLYDGTQTRPGTVIKNIATGSYESFGVHLNDLKAESNFTVQPHIRTSPARLRAMQLATPGAGAEIVGVHTSDYSPDQDVNGPFTSMVMPQSVQEARDRFSAGNAIPDGIVSPLWLSEVERIYPNRIVFWVLDDATLNYDSTKIDSVSVSLSDSVTGDTEVLRFWETGPNTGQFSAWIQTLQNDPKDGNGIMSTRPLSQINAVYEDPFNQTRNLSDAVVVGPVDPFGILFDSATGQPIDGVEVTIIDVSTGLPAKVWGLDLMADYPSTVTTGGTVTDSSGATYNLEPGEYRFPFVSIGQYRLEVNFGENYTVPSVAPDEELQNLPGAPFTIVQGSRLGVFEVVPGPPVEIDIPADRMEIAQVTRTADRDIAEVGDFVQYTVEIIPSFTGPLDITDLLPLGVETIESTIEINGETYENDLNDRREMFWDDFPATRGVPIIIKYVSQVGVSASGKITTTTRVRADGVVGAKDDHILEVIQPFNLDTMVIVGDVTSGACGEDNEDVNLSGIRVYLESGDYAITDEKGRFSFRDISNRPRVLQIDELTLPRGAEAVLCEDDTRKAGNPRSQFVNATPGFLQRAHFRIQFGSDEERLESNAQRPVVGIPALSEISDYERKDGDYASSITPHLALAGYVDLEKQPKYSLSWLETLSDSASPGLLSPRDGELPRRSSITIEVLKIPSSNTKVYVNGDLVSNLHKRASISTPKHRLMIERWNGVSIKEGRNEVKLVMTGLDGSVTEEVREVLYATSIDQAKVVQDGSRLRTDGRSTPIVKVQLLGKGGIPLRPGTQVVARISSPMTFELHDRRRSQSGSLKSPMPQTRVTVEEDGMISLTLSPILQNDTAVISFPRGSEEDPVEVEVAISAADRPWIFLGLAEGSWAEKSIRRHMRLPGDHQLADGAIRSRASFFAEGVIKGKWLTTLRYDTAHDEEEFYQIDPDKDYWIFGDRSSQGSAAKSRFPLYLRLKTEEAEFLIGDFTPEIDSELMKINGQMTGAKYSYENDIWRIVAFAAEASQTLMTDRIPLNGTSGPFKLSMGQVVSGSELVTVETVSKDDATETLGKETLLAGVDYVIDRSAGTVHLRKPITAFTSDRDRNVLVVTYETKTDSEKGFVGGVRAEHQVSENVRIGASAITSDKIEGGNVKAEAQSLDVDLKLSDTLGLYAEVLRMKKSDGMKENTGLSGIVRFDVESEKHKIKAYLKSIEGSTEINPNLHGDKVHIFGANASLKISELASEQVADDHAGKEEGMSGSGIYLETDVIAERNISSDSDTNSASFMLTSKSEHLTLGAGLEKKDNREKSEHGESTKATILIEAKTRDDKLSFSLGASRALKNTGDLDIPDVATLRVGYSYDDRLTIFASHELSFGKLEDRVSTVGVEYAPWEGGKITSGLVGADASGVSGQGIFFGASQKLQVGEGVILKFAIDGQRDLNENIPVGGTIGNPYLQEAFTTTSIETRKTTETWSAGSSFEYSITDT
jgi:hypothetical protein